jgi:hypothetical protein
MSRLVACSIALTIIASISACSFKKSPASETSNQSAASENKNAEAKPAPTQSQTQPGDIQG